MLDINTKFTKAIHGAVDAISKRNSFCLFLKNTAGHPINNRILLSVFNYINVPS